MTFRIKMRGAPGLLIAEYRCPEHGVFEALVDRDTNGDPPVKQPCPAAVLGCSHPSPWTISAPRPKVDSIACFAAIPGGDLKNRPPGMLDTRPLAEGMKYSEWQKLQRNHQRARRHKQMVDKGLIQKKIIVG